MGWGRYALRGAVAAVLFGGITHVASCSEDDSAKPGGDASTNVDRDATISDPDAFTNDDASAVDGSLKPVSFPSTPFVYVRIDAVIRILPPETGADAGASGVRCSAETVDGCLVRRCQSIAATPPDAGTVLLNGIFTITNESRQAAGDDGSTSPVTSSTDLATIATTQGAEFYDGVGYDTGDTIHVTWSGAAGLPPVDVRLKVPANPSAKFETTPPAISPTSGMKLAWIRDPASMLVRLSADPFVPAPSSAYCPFDRAATSQGAITGNVIRALGYCVDGGRGRADVETIGLAIASVTGSPVGVVLGLENPLFKPQAQASCKP